MGARLERQIPIHFNLLVAEVSAIGWPATLRSRLTG
jgi:hypothetical protein